jgi:hypothetical protein
MRSPWTTGTMADRPMAINRPARKARHSGVRNDGAIHAYPVANAIRDI